MPFLQFCLKGEAESRGPRFEPQSIAENTFNAGDVWGRIPPAGDCLTIGIDADRRSAAEPAPAQGFVE